MSNCNELPKNWSGGARRLISSNSAYAFDADSYLEFEITLPDFIFSLRFEFKPLQNDGIPTFSWFGDDIAKRVTINLIGFDDPLGRSNKKPINIGHYQHRPMLLNFFVSQMSNDSPHKVEYSLYLDVSGGENDGK